MLCVGCFGVILLEYFLFFMEICLIYWLVSFLSPVHIQVCNCTSVIIVTFFVTWGCCMNWLLGNHLKGFVVIVDCDVSPIDVSMKFLESKNY